VNLFLQVGIEKGEVGPRLKKISSSLGLHCRLNFYHLYHLYHKDTKSIITQRTTTTNHVTPRVSISIGSHVPAKPNSAAQQRHQLADHHSCLILECSGKMAV
jgi:hypothetical protein